MRLANNKRNNQNQKPQIKRNENKTNVATIVTPLVLIPSIAAAGFGIWYAIKHVRKVSRINLDL
ncbi:hypothetical protein [Mycoplasmopsis cynos]|uniref:Uncharacterized protein n=1 Tax=Mycoplasmopsis cynos TaxID=171284 RepID=A0A449AH91_9BACT|nr:hypothetical protein [Mycoplasmopsis cynos]VEU64310.1 Uncharacterised protein [Mycoplasmopsis cynos]